MSKQVTRRPTKQDRRQERREEQARREAERQRAARRKKSIILGSVIAAVLVLATVITYYIFSNGQNQNQNQSQVERIVNPQYPPIDNIYCDQQEQTAFHIHAHLSMYINGQQVPLSKNVSIAPDNSCLYWLHTHDTTGVIHIEAPAGRSFTLGNFLDIWSGEFSQLNYPSQLDLSGWKAYVNGQPYKGDFHKIPLQAHTLITLAYNSPNVTPDTTYSWNGL